MSFRLHLPVGVSPSVRPSVRPSARHDNELTDTPPGVYVAVFSGVTLRRNRRSCHSPRSDTTTGWTDVVTAGIDPLHSGIGGPVTLLALTPQRAGQTLL